MPAVFVHGVPETPAVWGPLLDALGRSDTVCLQLPGFGAPLPQGFEPTKDRYAAWLADELSRVGGPVDLVTHDWGALLAVKVLADRPTNVRSWVTDNADLPDDFQWHDTARVWQTPGDGEAMIEGVVAAPVDDRAAILEAAGAPAAGARMMAETFDASMGATILTLYRSAVDVGREWGPGLDDITVPALVIDAPLDGFRSEGAQAALARRLGAETTRLDDQGHWWMIGDPAGAGRAIESFWSSLTSPT